jgi:hypothetical protein
MNDEITIPLPNGGTWPVSVKRNQRGLITSFEVPSGTMRFITSTYSADRQGFFTDAEITRVVRSHYDRGQISYPKDRDQLLYQEIEKIIANWYEALPDDDKRLMYFCPSIPWGDCCGDD